MTLDSPTPLLGDLSPSEFMRRYWQRKPLLIRQAIPGFKSPISPAEVKRLARCDEVESRLVWRESDQWQMEQGPFSRLPAVKQPGWSVLVQSVDQHDDNVAALMHQFRYIVVVLVHALHQHTPARLLDGWQARKGALFHLPLVVFPPD